MRKLIDRLWIEKGRNTDNVKSWKETVKTKANNDCKNKSEKKRRQSEKDRQK